MKAFLTLSLGVVLFASPSAATCIPYGPASGFQGVTIGSKLKTAPVRLDHKVGLAGGGALAPGLYDVEVASTGDKSRVMLLFFQKGRKVGETPGALKLGPSALYGPNCNTKIFGPNCNKAGGVVPCNGNPKGGVAQGCITFKDQQPGARNCVAKGCITFKGGQQATSKRYLTFEQLGFAGGVKPSLRAGAGGGTLLTIPGAGGASVEAQLPAAH